MSNYGDMLAYWSAEGYDAHDARTFTDNAIWPEPEEEEPQEENEE